MTFESDVVHGYPVCEGNRSTPRKQPTCLLHVTNKLYHVMLHRGCYCYRKPGYLPTAIDLHAASYIQSLLHYAIPFSPYGLIKK
jgi:hypothetical protein